MADPVTSRTALASTSPSALAIPRATISNVRRNLLLLFVGVCFVAVSTGVGVTYRNASQRPAPLSGPVTTVVSPLTPDGSAQVWVKVTTADEGGTVVFSIGPWRREVVAPAGTTTFGFTPPVDLAEPEPPLIVSASGVDVEVGRGRVPEAVLVDDDWEFSPRPGS
jgi:hypothetical protein